jgi:hypothetical protein
MRDDFSSKIKDTLSKRVGLHCSNPNCRSLTSGPNTYEHIATNIGVASHITAASPNGPRYDASLTQIERSSIRNGIWLCQSCAKLIDSDPKKYSVELIRKWKTEAEKETELELTKTKKTKKTKDYDEIFKLMPTLINEFKFDIENNPLLREFILLEKGWAYNSGGRKVMVYFYEDHEDLDAKMRLLENNGLINDITFNNTKRYVLTEKFVGILKNLDKYAVN